MPQRCSALTPPPSRCGWQLPGRCRGTEVQRCSDLCDELPSLLWVWARFRTTNTFLAGQHNGRELRDGRMTPAIARCLSLPLYHVISRYARAPECRRHNASAQ